MVLICISLVMNIVEPLFIGLLALHIYFFMKYLLKSFPYCFIGCFPPYYQVVRIGINPVDSMGSKLTPLFDTSPFGDVNILD